MKKILNLSLIALVVFGLFSCNDGSSPKDVAEKYLESFSKGDFETAKSFATKESASMLDLMASLNQEVGADEKSTVKVEFKDAKCDIDGETAIYTCNLVVTDENNEDAEVQETEESINLVKVDGKWLVKQEKEGGNDFNFEDDDFDYDEDFEEMDEVEGEEIAE